MTITLTKATNHPGIHTSCLHCHRTIALPNIPVTTLRGNHIYGYTHLACSAPFLILANLNSSLHTYSTEGN